MSDRLEAQLAFLLEADKLRHVLRDTTLADGSRKENSGEHSWHVCLMALVLADQAAPGVDLLRVLKMLLIHDIVEIDTGDTPIHATEGHAHGSQALALEESRAADRIFGLLPPDIGAELRALWEEFEAHESPDACFAKSLDRVQPCLMNLASGGGSWLTRNVSLAQIDARVGTKASPGAPRLWAHVRAKVADWFAAR